MNRNLLDHLKSNSHDLKSLGEEFPKWLVDRQNGAGRRVRVMCFFEELPTPPVGLIVSRESAQIAGFDYVSLPADHVGMCKFENFEDPKYKTVLYTLRKWVEEIKTMDESGQTKTVGCEGMFSIRDLLILPWQVAPQVKTKMGDNYGGSQVGSDSSSHRSGDNISSTFVSGTSKQP